MRQIGNNGLPNTIGDNDALECCHLQSTHCSAPQKGSTSTVVQPHALQLRQPRHLVWVSHRAASSQHGTVWTRHNCHHRDQLDKLQGSEAAPLLSQQKRQRGLRKRRGLGRCCGHEAVDLSSDSSFTPTHRGPRSRPTEYSLTTDKTQRCQRARKSNNYQVHLYKYMHWLQHLAITSHLLPKPTPPPPAVVPLLIPNCCCTPHLQPERGKATL